MYPAQKEKLISVLKLIFTIIVFIVAIVAISFLFSAFFQPVGQEKLRYETCTLLQSPDGSQVDCFGCVNGENCKDAPIDWVLYEKPAVGIPYACYEEEEKCELAQ